MILARRTSAKGASQKSCVFYSAPSVLSTLIKGCRHNQRGSDPKHVCEPTAKPHPRLSSTRIIVTRYLDLLYGLRE